MFGNYFGTIPKLQIPSNFPMVSQDTHADAKPFLPIIHISYTHTEGIYFKIDLTELIREHAYQENQSGTPNPTLIALKETEQQTRSGKKIKPVSSRIDSEGGLIRVYR